jgi:hypothetical protein
MTRSTWQAGQRSPAGLPLRSFVIAGRSRSEWSRRGHVTLAAGVRARMPRGHSAARSTTAAKPRQPPAGQDLGRPVAAHPRPLGPVDSIAAHAAEAVGQCFRRARHVRKVHPRGPGQPGMVARTTTSGSRPPGSGPSCSLPSSGRWQAGANTSRGRSGQRCAVADERARGADGMGAGARGRPDATRGRSADVALYRAAGASDRVRSAGVLRQHRLPDGGRTAIARRHYTAGR